MTKITEGANDRPKDETIAQSGGGIPDDSGAPIEACEEEVARVRTKLGVDDRQGHEKDREPQDGIP